MNCLIPDKHEQGDNNEDEGRWNFMVNVVQPQFNLHSADANVSILMSLIYFSTIYNDFEEMF